LPQSAPLNLPQTLAQGLALHKQGKPQRSSAALRPGSRGPGRITSKALQYLALIRYDQAQYGRGLAVHRQGHAGADAFAADPDASRAGAERR